MSSFCKKNFFVFVLSLNPYINFGKHALREANLEGVYTVTTFTCFSQGADLSHIKKQIQFEPIF